MKIAGFCQLHNELAAGHLHNWIKCQDFCDYIYVFDQASTDGSQKVYKQHDNIRVIYSPTNRFKEELICKQELLEKLLREAPDTDWIFWMDGDTITSTEFTREAVVKELTNTSPDVDQLNVGHYNLWRSDKYFRIDNQYHSLNLKTTAFWRVHPDMRFPVEKGLHKTQAPINTKGTARSYLKLFHRGFATDYHIRRRYSMYRDLGQQGYKLSRLLSEDGLQVAELNEDLLHPWLDDIIRDNPMDMQRLSKIADVSVAAMIYKCPKYYELIVDQLCRYATAEHYPVKTMLVANDPTPEIEEMINKETRIDHTTIYRDPKSEDFYLNRVYRCWNHIVGECKTSAIVLVNSDMAFSPGWLDTLLKTYTADNIPCSKLVESGKMRSGKYVKEKDLGRSPETYDEKGFLKYAEEIKEPGRISPGGLYMPCLFLKQDFIDAGGYPEGNIHAGGPGEIHTRFIRSGDLEFFNRTGKQHVTVFDSIVYHIQEGEKDA
jgi:hypothetical protein